MSLFVGTESNNNHLAFCTEWLIRLNGVIIWKNLLKMRRLYTQSGSVILLPNLGYINSSYNKLLCM